MLDFEWYRSFIAVYRAGTVTGAAQARYLTQPAISQHIAALESHTGHLLFDRKPRRMVPTAHGKALYTRLASSMDSLERLSNTLRHIPAQELSSMRLGAPFDFFHEIGWKRLKDAQFRLRVEFGETGELIDALSHGRLDAVIATQRINAVQIDHTKIGTEAFCLIAAPDQPPLANMKRAATRKRELERALLDYPWISYSEELPIIRRFWQIVFNKRPDMAPAVVVPSLLMIRSIVESGRGISIVPRYICQHSLDTGRLKVLWQPKDVMVNELWLATRKVDRNKPELTMLKTLLIPEALEHDV
jgi:DNA-binding transcriptional LysR family regulator